MPARIITHAAQGHQYLHFLQQFPGGQPPVGQARTETAFYSAGFSPMEMIDLFNGMNFFRDIVAPSAPKGGFFNSRPLVKHIQEVMPYKRIEELPVPVYIAASDMDHGKTVIFSEGELAPRLVASCSIPVVFQPMVIDGVHYIDGGVFMSRDTLE